MERRVKLVLPQPQLVISQRCLLIFPGYTLFLPFITPLKLIVCKRFECVSVLVVARRSSQANRGCGAVGKKQEAFVSFHPVQHSFAALSILPSVSPTHLAPSP